MTSTYRCRCGAEMANAIAAAVHQSEVHGDFGIMEDWIGPMYLEVTIEQQEQAERRAERAARKAAAA